ncbi:hypothetical protein [Nocardia sp. NPDC050175]|uniref:hypothetical protein n=1 Tax=Nocardia sp. NPDC050175 TaxID=3364317 RepID=UPI00379C18EE
MTTRVTVDGLDLDLVVENNMLVISIVENGVPIRRGSLFIGKLEPAPGPIYIEPDPVAPQPDPNAGPHA